MSRGIADSHAGSSVQIRKGAHPKLRERNKHVFSGDGSNDVYIRGIQAIQMMHKDSSNLGADTCTMSDIALKGHGKTSTQVTQLPPIKSVHPSQFNFRYGNQQGHKLHPSIFNAEAESKKSSFVAFQPAHNGSQAAENAGNRTQLANQSEQNLLGNSPSEFQLNQLETKQTEEGTLNLHGMQQQQQLQLKAIFPEENCVAGNARPLSNLTLKTLFQRQQFFSYPISLEYGNTLEDLKCLHHLMEEQQKIFVSFDSNLRQSLKQQFDTRKFFHQMRKQSMISAVVDQKYIQQMLQDNFKDVISEAITSESSEDDSDYTTDQTQSNEEGEGEGGENQRHIDYLVNMELESVQLKFLKKRVKFDDEYVDSSTANVMRNKIIA